MPDNRSGIVEVGNLPVHCLYERRIDNLELRENFIADAIALVVGREVGTVIPVFYTPGKSIALNLLAGEIKHRTGEHYLPCSGVVFVIHFANRHCTDALHPGYPIQSRASQKVEHQSLSIVIGIVRHGSISIAIFAANLGEPSVTKFAGSHLDAYRMFRSIAFSVERCKVQPYPMTLSPGFDQRLVTIAFGTT